MSEGRPLQCAGRTCKQQATRTGRLTEPLKWDAESDKYVRVDWAEAFADIGARLQKLNPQSVIFYASGRAALETSFLYQLLARVYGNNNLPDSSNTTPTAIP